MEPCISTLRYTFIVYLGCFFDVSRQALLFNSPQRVTAPDCFIRNLFGFPFFLPKGMVLKNLLIDYWRKLHEREGYVEVSTPVILDRSLWETSGHWEHYRENMYTLMIDGKGFAVKPMSCPGGMLIYKMEPCSYRELPMRIGELGLIHRNEKLGYKIREARQDRVPYMVILGEKEQASGTLSVRYRDAQDGQQDMGEMEPEKFIALFK